MLSGGVAGQAGKALGSERRMTAHAAVDQPGVVERGQLRVAVSRDRRELPRSFVKLDVHPHELAGECLVQFVNLLPSYFHFYRKDGQCQTIA